MGVSCFAQAVDQDDGQLWAVVTGQKSRVVPWGGRWMGALCRYGATGDLLSFL